LSVSQPLATSGSNGKAENGPREQGRQAEAAHGARPTTSSTELPEYLIHAPKQLSLETRVEFRAVAADLIDQIPAGAGKVVIDCSSLQMIDSVGLNALIILQRRAAARRVQIVLRDLEIELRALLVLTKLEDLFDLEAY
jgi:anti-anti-sigma factor